ncbi:MAG: hypothetical protein ACJAZ0_000670 [Halioglobus sp.]|jgi:hypothetical protein
MNDNTKSPPAGLDFTDNISITWKKIDYRPSEAHLVLVNESNESFLRAVSAMGEITMDNADDEAGLSQEVLRLDLKVNLLLDLVSQLIYKQLEIPAVSKVTMSSREIEWRSEKVPQPGQMVFVEAYIEHGTPKPMCFYGEVVSSQLEYHSNAARVRYVGLAGSVQSWLDKLIFRHHRRAVAYEKSRNTDS